MQRTEITAQLGRKQFDVLIIGGGIVGGGVARDAAMRGLSVALIEQGDFASGASSKTSKLIHGGLRYLEHGHLSLVFESLQERKTLRRIAPSLVQSIPILIPIYPGDSRPVWKIKIGLRLYALLALGDRPRSSRVISIRRALAQEKALARERLQGAGLYADCQMDDARLCLANILQAIDFGALCCNYVRLQTFMKAKGRICGVIAEDLPTGKIHEIQARVVVNATGPWGDHVRRLSQSNALNRMAPTKGIHLILPKLVRHGLFVQARSDRRMLFVLPWGASTLIGTTESPISDPLERLSASRDDVEYLLNEVNRVLPEARVQGKDVIATFAGARPLLAFSGNAGAASRRHRIEEDRSGLVSVMGGKYTTYRRMAQQSVDFLIKRYRYSAKRCQTNQINLIQSADPGAIDSKYPTTEQIDTDVLRRLFVRYGIAAAKVLHLLKKDPILAAPICSHHRYLAAEIAHAIQNELACTVTDILARRTQIAWSPCHGLDGLSTVIGVLERYGGISRLQVEQQAEDYRQFVENSKTFRK